MEYTLNIRLVGLQTDVNEMRSEVNDLRKEVRVLRKEMCSLRKEVRSVLQLVSKSHAKMDQHVDFVEGVYKSIRHPLDFAKKRIEQFIGDGKTSTYSSLPQLEGPRDENST